MCNVFLIPIKFFFYFIVGIKNWCYDIAESEYGRDVFTWAEYDRILNSNGKKQADALEVMLVAGWK